MLLVGNKIDLLESESSEADKLQKIHDFFRTSGLPDFRTIAISAKQKQHIDELKQRIYSSAIKDQLSGDETLVTNIRHLEALQKTEEALIRVLEGIGGSITSDFLSMDIKQALHYLGEITG